MRKRVRCWGGRIVECAAASCNAAAQVQGVFAPMLQAAAVSGVFHVLFTWLLVRACANAYPEARPGNAMPCYARAIDNAIVCVGGGGGRPGDGRGHGHGRRRARGVAVGDRERCSAGTRNPPRRVMG